MSKWQWVLAPILLFVAAPAFAAPCTTRGTVEAPIQFPKNEPGDIDFARSMVPVMLPRVLKIPALPSCTRTTVRTALGDYVIGSENGEAIPRLAVRADGKPGPVVFLAMSPDLPGTMALVVRQGSLTTIKLFYGGIPTDRRLADDVRTALAGPSGVMSYDADRKIVSYAFVPAGPVPSPVKPSVSVKTAGPQILVSGAGDFRLLDGNMRHTPSGFACPQTFDGLQVLLMSIDPRADYLSCDYRSGTDLRFNAEDPVRYSITLIKARGATPRSVFEQLTAGARATLRIKGDHTPPLATGPAPAPQFVAYWDTEKDGVQGAWVGQAGRWVIWLRAQYPPSAATDAEAGQVARRLFAAAADQVK